MNWNKSLSVGNEKIDKQHKELIDNINKLKKIDFNNINIKEVEDLLNFIISYTIKHFSEEEALMKKYNYPDLDNHIKLHLEFKKDITDAINNIKTQNYSKLSISSLKVKLSSWLISHILNEDRKYSTYLK